MHLPVPGIEPRSPVVLRQCFYPLGHMYGQTEANHRLRGKNKSDLRLPEPDRGHTSFLRGGGGRNNVYKHSDTVKAPLCDFLLSKCYISRPHYTLSTLYFLVTLHQATSYLCGPCGRFEVRVLGMRLGGLGFV